MPKKPTRRRACGRLKDLDGAAATLADVCRVLLDPALPDDRVRSMVFEKIPQPLLKRAVENVDALIRPPEDVFYIGANYGHCTIRLLTKNSSYNAAVVADDGLTGLSVPMFPKPLVRKIFAAGLILVFKDVALLK
jgi:hypothetical protein